MTAYSYTKKTQEDIVLLEVSPMPDWQEFGEFIEVFLLNEKAQLIANDYGMDRHQVRYRINDRSYILQFEHYTGSIWIENDY